MSPKKPAAGAAGGPARRRRSPASFFLSGPTGRSNLRVPEPPAGMQSPAAPRIWPGGTLAVSGSGNASTPPATGTELSRLPSNRPDPKADQDEGMAPAAGYVGVCYISVTMVHHC
jgi:hypothetical protein